MQSALANEMRIVNAMYKKRTDTLATYRIGRTLEDITFEQIGNNTHAQTDSILVNIRWRNLITNADSYMRANMNSDHFPLVFTIRLKLNHMKEDGKLDHI